MKKILPAITIMCIALTSPLPAGEKPIAVSITKTTSEVLKLSWVSTNGISYRIESSLSALGPWQTYSVEYRVDNQMTMRRSLVVDEKPRFYRVYGETQGEVPLTNLIPNGDLELVENGVLPVGWTHGGYGTNVRDLHFPVQGPDGLGDKAVEVLIKDWVDGDVKWVFQDIPVDPLAEYAFEDSYRATSPTATTVQFRDKFGNLSYLDIGSFPVSLEWINSFSEFRTPENTKSLTVFHRLSENGRLATDNAFLYQLKPTIQPLAEGIVSFDFDDGWREPYKLATRILGEAGFKATFYIYSDAVGAWKDGYVFWDDVLEMQRLGHEIGAHTLTHSDLTTLTTADMEREINLSRNYLLKNGIHSVNSFAYPYGAYNPAIQKLVREAGFTIARSADLGINEKGTTDQYGLQVIGMLANTNIDEVLAIIKKTKIEKGWVILLFHHINESGSDYSVTPEFFTRIVDYVKSEGIKVVKATEGGKLMFAP